MTKKDEKQCLADLDTNRDGSIQFKYVVCLMSVLYNSEYVNWLVRIGTLQVKTFVASVPNPKNK